MPLTNLPDSGTLFYNGILFDCLYTSTVKGKAVKDAANRTVKWMEYTLTVEGTITMRAGEATSDARWLQIRQILSEQGGVLRYTGKGFGQFDINVGGGAGAARDLCWGPKPEVLDFRPLGGSRSAQIVWTCTICIAENAIGPTAGPGLRTPGAAPGAGLAPVVQFNEECTISYDDDGYSSIAVRGTLEIPLTRIAFNNRSIPDTVDSFRARFLNFTGGGGGLAAPGAAAGAFDLTIYRVTHRSFNVSRDMRTMEWEVTVEEIPPQGLPMGATVARGTFSCRPTKDGPGLISWLCSLRCTYTIRQDFPRRMAWWAFITLLHFRMWQSRFGHVPFKFKTIDIPPPPDFKPPKVDDVAPPPPAIVPPNVFHCLAAPLLYFVLEAGMRLLTWKNSGWLAVLATLSLLIGGFLGWADRTGRQIIVTATGTWATLMGFGKKDEAPKKDVRRAWLIHFGVDEGLYLDSKTISFEASWRLITTFEFILEATGVWQYSPAEGKNLWASTMADIMGHQSWLPNRLDPNTEVIVDMGGP